jgi:hypothetical protein
VELTWWPVAAAGLGGLALAGALALLLPSTRNHDRKVPLANTARLTRLPEYRAVVRRQTRVTAVVLTLLALLFVATTLASARPTGMFWEADVAPPRQDIMLCSAAPVTDQANAGFLGYFARQTTTYGSERIGLTSLNRRLIPLTRDHQFASGRLADFARASPAAPRFSAPVGYDGYTPTVADVLALCLTGFPDFETGSDTLRSLIYLGPGALRSPADTGPSLFTDEQVIDMARRAAVQINAIATPGRETESLSTVARATDGLFFRYGATDVDGQLDAVRTETLSAAADSARSRQDSPVAVLVVTLALSALLGVALMAGRR